MEDGTTRSEKGGERERDRKGEIWRVEELEGREGESDRRKGKDMKVWKQGDRETFVGEGEKGAEGRQMGRRKLVTGAEI